MAATRKDEPTGKRREWLRDNGIPLITIVACATLLLVGSAARAGDDPLTIEIETGDSVTLLIARHAEEIRRFIPDQGPWRRLSADQVVQRLLRQNLRSLPHGVYPKNLVAIHKDGQIAVTAGAGRPPEPFANNAQLRALVGAIPNQVHDQVEELARQGSVPLRPFTITEDGQSVEVSGKTFRAGEGIRFVGRTAHFHVVGNTRPNLFNVAVWPFAGVPFTFPPSPYYRQIIDGTIALKRAEEGTLARLLAARELRAHDDHYHVTRTFSYEPWQRLVKLAASESTPRIRKALAVSIQVRLLGEHLYISSTDTARDLADLETRLGRLWQAFEDNLDGPQLTFVYDHNAAIERNGKLLLLDRETLSAGEGLNFGFCKFHVHIHGEPGINVAVQPPELDERLVVPKNVFVAQNGESIATKAMGPDLAAMLSQGQIAARDHSYHVTDRFHSDTIRDILQVVSNRDLAPDVREGIKAELDAILAEALPIATEAELLAAATALGQRLDALHAKLP